MNAGREIGGIRGGGREDCLPLWLEEGTAQDCTRGLVAGAEPSRLKHSKSGGSSCLPRALAYLALTTAWGCCCRWGQLSGSK